MKKLSLIALLLFVPLILSAQYRGKGSIDIQGGIGFGTVLDGSGLPISLSADYGWDADKQIGGYFGFAKTSTGFWDTRTSSWVYAVCITRSSSKASTPMREP